MIHKVKQNANLSSAHDTLRRRSGISAFEEFMVTKVFRSPKMIERVVRMDYKMK